MEVQEVSFVGTIGGNQNGHDLSLGFMTLSAAFQLHLQWKLAHSLL